MPQILVNATYQTLLSDISKIYLKAKSRAKQEVDKILIEAYWNIGKRIVNTEQNSQERAPYGNQLIEHLSENLTQKLGNGFSVTNLRYMRQFYIAYPIRQVSGELNWTHFQALSTIKDKETREYYQHQAQKNQWSSRQLNVALKKDKVDRQIIVAQRPQEYEEEQTDLEFHRGVLYTYQWIDNPVFPVENHYLILNLGFNFWREIPSTGLHPLNGSLVQSKKVGREYFLEVSQTKESTLYTYKAFVERVVDGDTLWCQIDCGFGNWTRQKLRLRGIDCPEITTQKGQQAKTFVEQKLRQVNFVVVKTYASDKYDRYLTELFTAPGDNSAQSVADSGQFLNQELLDKGLAVKV